MSYLYFLFKGLDFVYTDILRGSQRNVPREILPLIQHNVELSMFVKYIPSYVFD